MTNVFLELVKSIVRKSLIPRARDSSPARRADPNRAARSKRHGGQSRHRALDMPFTHHAPPPASGQSVGTALAPALSLSLRAREAHTQKHQRTTQTLHARLITHTHRHTHTDTDTHARALSLSHTACQLPACVRETEHACNVSDCASVKSYIQRGLCQGSGRAREESIII